MMLRRLQKQLHPYEEPVIIAFPILAGSASYFAWILQETGREQPREELEALNALPDTSS